MNSAAETRPNPNIEPTDRSISCIEISKAMPGDDPDVGGVLNDLLELPPVQEVGVRQTGARGALDDFHRHQPRELGAAADVELAVDLAEVVLDRLGREEERRRRLAVGHA